MSIKEFQQKILNQVLTTTSSENTYSPSLGKTSAIIKQLRIEQNVVSPSDKIKANVKEKTTIYRVEHSHFKDNSREIYNFVKYGPYYSSSFIGTWTNKSTKRHTDKKHPNLERDKILSENIQKIGYLNTRSVLDLFCFGFTSIDQLKKWFAKKERTTLANKNFIIAIYEATEIATSDFQCIFKPDSERISTLSLIEI